MSDSEETAAPDAVFRTARLDTATGNPLTYSFPVAEGTEVEVYLYFAETQASSIKARVFDVLLDERVPPEFDDIDVFAEVGAWRPLVKRARITSDGSVDVQFLAEVGQPMISGLEVTVTEVEPSAEEHVAPELRKTWQSVLASGGLEKRHENGIAAVGKKVYVLGGRGAKRTGIFKPATTRWNQGPAPPIELHHFQAAAIGHEIFVVGAFTGDFPSETPVANVYVYDTRTNKWRTGPKIPENRRRGAAAVIAHAGKLYVAGGQVDGHKGGTVPWFDRFDPVSGSWHPAADMPRLRDHFQGAVVDGKLVLAGGRVTSFATRKLFQQTVGEVDVYDFATGTWLTLPPSANLPTERAGASVFAEGGWLVVVGGEGAAQGAAHSEVEALHLEAQSWTMLPGLAQGRHGTGVARIGRNVYTAAGSAKRGKALELASIEVWSPPSEALSAVSFTPKELAGIRVNNPTSLAFGPDGRLYVAQQDGAIFAYTVRRGADGSYRAGATESIRLLQDIVNHQDTGERGGPRKKRQVTGILVRGSAQQPLLWATSSDPRIGAGGGSKDLNLDTNSGVLSKLTKHGNSWHHVQYVRGLPRSEENHAANGLTFDPKRGVLYVTQGGNTNAGAPSNNFAFSNEYALSAAILSIDIAAIEQRPTQVDAWGQHYKYDIPTLDDPLRENLNGITSPAHPNYNGIDINDPFGGNNGLNQAKWVPGGPVQVLAGGFRNPYDVLLTKSGRLYSVDNGANAGWGGHPKGESHYPGPRAGRCTNEYVKGEPGSASPGPNDQAVNNHDSLHWVPTLDVEGTQNGAPTERFYGGHPNPIRGNPEGAGLYRNRRFLRNGHPRLPVDWPPVPPELAQPAECDFRNAGVSDGALATFATSVNGLAEYTANNFGGALKGAILAAGFDGTLFQIKTNERGDQATNCPAAPATCANVIAAGAVKQPLDVVAQGSDERFPGSIWIAGFGSDNIVVLEPTDIDGRVDFSSCAFQAARKPASDEDNDGYSNKDERANRTDPCSAATRPNDVDQDGLSDLLDPDDDNDTIPDHFDPFVLDAHNGLQTKLPVHYEFFNNDPGTGYFGIGFTGLLTKPRGSALVDFESIVAGGTAGLFTIPAVSSGHAHGKANSLSNGFQFGVALGEKVPVFTAATQINGPFFNGLSAKDQSHQGLMVSAGNQHSFVEFALRHDFQLGLLVEARNKPVVERSFHAAPHELATASAVKLYLTIDAQALTAQAAYQIPGKALQALGTVALPRGAIIAAARGGLSLNKVPSSVAVGIVATGTQPFAATWDWISVFEGPPSAKVVADR